MDRYEEALERARQGKPIDEVFPELKESEDERIRIGLIEIFNSALGQDFLQRKAGLDRDKVIAYLEKQKEHHYTKRNDLFDKCVENCDSATMKEVSDNVDAILQKEQKPAEWSKADEEMLDAMIDIVSNSLYEPLCPREGMLAWLKSLRPHWKPSEEQMNELFQALIPGRDYDCDVLQGLHDDLRKLM